MSVTAAGCHQVVEQLRQQLRRRLLVEAVQRGERGGQIARLVGRLARQVEQHRVLRLEPPGLEGLVRADPRLHRPLLRHEPIAELRHVVAALLALRLDPSEQSLQVLGRVHVVRRREEPPLRPLSRRVWGGA